MNMRTCKFCGVEIANKGNWNYAMSTCKKCKNSTIKDFDFIEENKRGYLN